MSTSTKAAGRKITRKRVASLHPSPENEQLYRKVSDDPDLPALAESIDKNGLHAPPIVTRDGFVVSGHRRLAALRLLGRVWVECIVLEVTRRDLSTNEFLALLRDHNHQRDKSAAEQVREKLIDATPGEAWNQVRQHRMASRHQDTRNGFDGITIRGDTKRHKISAAKTEHVYYLKKVVLEERRDYWPISARSAHYPLLNHRFLRNTEKGKAYANDDPSYKATTNLLVRLRLNGEIPWEAITDETRPVVSFNPYRDVRTFVEKDLDDLFCGYWRDRLQTQPNHVEVLCEKNTILHMVERVTSDYQLPTSSARGYDSISALRALYCRFRQSKRDRLIIIALCDFDPEGEDIPNVVARTMRDDFGVPEHKVTVIKAGVTQEQIDKYQLPPLNKAKKTSSRHKGFVSRNGSDLAYELEALNPEDMLRDLRATIEGVLDLELFQAEVEREEEEADALVAYRETALERLRGMVE